MRINVVYWSYLYLSLLIFNVCECGFFFYWFFDVQELVFGFCRRVSDYYLCKSVVVIDYVVWYIFGELDNGVFCCMENFVFFCLFYFFFYYVLVFVFVCVVVSWGFQVRYDNIFMNGEMGIGIFFE